MNSKEINRESGRFFKALLLPSWAERSQEDQEDYGVDFEIELMTPEDKATGFIFKIQLKGTSVASYDASGQVIYSAASVERFRYYIGELRIPLIFIFCDVTTGDCFWTRVQGNRQLESALSDAVDKDQKTFTIKFAPSRKVLKTAESAGEIIVAVENALDTITLRGLQAISPASVHEHIGHEPDIEATEKQFRSLAGIAASESIRKMVKSGDFMNAVSKARSLFESEYEPADVRLVGGLSLAHTYNVKLRLAGEPDAAIKAAKVKFGIAKRMLGISRQKTCETRMKRYVRIYTRAARMHINGQIAMALAFSEQTQAHQMESISGPITHLYRLQVSTLVSKDFFKLCDALCRLGAKEMFSVIPYALEEITESIHPYVSALRILERADLADAYVNALFDFLPFCVGVVRRFGDASDIPEILKSLGMRFVRLADASDESSMPELLKQFEQALEGEPAFGCLSEVQDALRKLVKEIQAASGAKAKPSRDDLRSYYAQQAAALGINLNDPHNAIAQIVIIGLEDLDPTRVAKNCQHIHVMTTSRGIPAEMLSLPTAGSKRIVCLKHGHSVENLRLDAAYKWFVQFLPRDKDVIRCENCPNKAPHPDGWEWTQDWDAHQQAKYQEIIKRDDANGEDDALNP
jgi:hypothetical protein